MLLLFSGSTSLKPQSNSDPAPGCPDDGDLTWEPRFVIAQHPRCLRLTANRTCRRNVKADAIDPISGSQLI
jgi:hypothetical protein